MHLQVNETIFHNWKIKKVIGEGSFGVVYEIEREEFGRVYKAAAKVISIPKDQYDYRDVLDDDMTEENVTAYYRSLVDDIIGECDLMERMKGDSHIVSYEDHHVVKEDNGLKWTIYIRMELLTPLVSCIKDRRLKQKDIVQLGIDMCRGLETCEKFNVIHRDIKPENIFISDTNNYKLGDFGISKALERSEMAVSKKGTQLYMAPEVYRGDQYDATVDIYSLGLVLFRLMNNNRAPFLPPAPEMIYYQDKEMALHKRLMGEPIPRPCNANDDFSRVIQKACSFQPKDRYQTPREMRRELEEVLYALENEINNQYIDLDNKTEKNNVDLEDSGGTLSVLGNRGKLSMKEEEVRLKAEEERRKIEEEERRKAELEAKIREEKRIREEEAKRKEEERIRAEEAKRQEERLRMEEEAKRQEEEQRQEEKRKHEIEERRRAEEEKRKAEIEVRRQAEEKAKIQILSEENSDMITHKSTGTTRNDNSVSNKNVMRDSNKHRMKVIASCCAIIFVLISIWIACTAKVPDITGMSVEQAKQQLEDSNLKVLEERYHSNDVPVGYILSQNKKAGNRILKNTTVIIGISKGPEEINMPDLINHSKEEAEKILSSLGMNAAFHVENAYSTTIEKGKICVQSPLVNKKLQSGSSITVYISEGAGVMPNVIGVTVENANTQLESFGMRVVVDEVYSSQVEAGLIVSQSVAEGSPIGMETEVILEVSKGVEMMLVPSVVGLTQEEAFKLLQDAGYKKKKITIIEEYNNDVVAGTVISQSIEAEIEVEKGSGITIYVSLGVKPTSNTYRPSTSKTTKQKKTQDDSGWGSVEVID